MKKVLKNASLFIITITLLFTGLITVNAEECSWNSASCRVGERGTIYSANGRQLTSSTKNSLSVVQGVYSNIGVTYKQIKNNILTETSNAYYGTYRDNYSAIYCFDPQFNGRNSLYAERFLYNKNDSLRTQAQDIALLYILTNGGKDIQKDPSGSDYWARLIAIRGVYFLFGNSASDTATGDNTGATYTQYATIYEWLTSDASAYNELNSALGSAGQSYLSPYNSSLYKEKYDKGYRYSGSAYNSARGYFNAALREAANFLNNKNSGEAKVDKVSINPDTTSKTSGSIVSKEVVHTLKASNLGKEAKFVLNGIKFVDNKVYTGLTSYISSIKIGSYSVTGRQNVANVLGKNLVELSGQDFSKDVTIEVTVHFEGDKKVLKCGEQPIKYYIDGTYASDGTGGAGLATKYKNYVATVWFSGEAGTQRFVGVEKLGNAGGTPGDDLDLTDITTNETNLIDACSCDDLLEACKKSGSLGSSECQELLAANCGECYELEAKCAFGDRDACKKKDEVCDLNCDATFDTDFECCDERGDLIVSTADDKKLNINGPAKNQACFVTKVDNNKKENTGYANVGIEDQKKNSYTLAATNNNKYCTVSCKEDYVMTMPTAKLVNAGRYFTFKTKIEGTKTCYTNTIDIEQYNKDIEEIQIKMINKYNEYKSWEAAESARMHNNEGTYVSRSTPYSYGCGCSNSYSDYISGASTETYSYYAKEAVRLGNGQITTRNVLEYDSKSISSQTRSEHTGTSSCKERYCTRWGEWYINKNGVRDRDCKNYEEYTRHQSCYKEVVVKVNTVSDLLAYIRRMKSQAASQLASLKTDYDNIIKEFGNCTKSWSSKMAFDPNLEYDYEKGYLSEFNKIGEMERSSLSNQTDTTNWFCQGDVTDNYSKCTTQAKNNVNATYVSRNYSVCTTSGCEIKTTQVSSAKYVKKSSSVSASYRPATLFYNVYPSGEITVNAGDNTVALENKVPVSLNTARGIYKYTVNVDKLGEFYNSTTRNNLGRYIGAATAVVDRNPLEYSCAYLVNMAITKDDRLVCDFDDTCTDDCISDCIGPNCEATCEGEDCIANCVGVGCIYDKDSGSQLLQKTVSLNNLFPNGTTSYNWDKSRNDKAVTTISEIENTGDAIFDSKPILSVTIDPSTARSIKQYNDEEEKDNKGGYSNDTLSCYSVDGQERIACYSSFITDLVSGKYGKDAVNKESLIADEKYRRVTDDNTEYFSTWKGHTSEEDMIGPSWK